MSAEEESITITTHYAVPTYSKVIHVPARFSLDETREAIHLAISKLMPEGCLTQPSSSIIIASEAIEDSTIGHVAFEDRFAIHAILSDAPSEMDTLVEDKTQTT